MVEGKRDLQSGNSPKDTLYWSNSRLNSRYRRKNSLAQRTAKKATTIDPSKCSNPKGHFASVHIQHGPLANY